MVVKLQIIANLPLKSVRYIFHIDHGILEDCHSAIICLTQIIEQLRQICQIISLCCVYV